MRPSAISSSELNMKRLLLLSVQGADQALTSAESLSRVKIPNEMRALIDVTPIEKSNESRPE